MSAGRRLNKLPYGNLPRLILAWVSHRSGADPKPRVGSREARLAEFMRTLGHLE